MNVPTGLFFGLIPIRFLLMEMAQPQEMFLHQNRGARAVTELFLEAILVHLLNRVTHLVVGQQQLVRHRAHLPQRLQVHLLITGCGRLSLMRLPTQQERMGLA